LGIIKLNDIRVYAYHGCLVEEGQIGSDYIVDLEVKADLSQASESDALSDTVDYVQLLKIVRREMATRSKLLEHVGQRIVDSTLQEIGKVREVSVAIAKINPPIGGDVREVRVIMTGKR
jgi:dihydroneopterin aldolase